LRKYTRERKTTEKGTDKQNPSTICLNRDCRIRKERPCKGFEGCPGYRSKP